MADLGDVSDLSCWERQSHYLDSYGGKKVVDREAAWPMASFAAQAEMLDEIHTMLRHLCGVQNDSTKEGLNDGS